MLLKRSPLYSLVLLLALFGALLAPAAVPPPTPVNAAPLTAVPADSAELNVIRQAYDLLLDRYVQPPRPAELLNAAYDAVATELSAAGVGVRPSSPLQDGAGRDEAWAGFQTRVSTLLKGTSLPPAFDLSAAAINGMAKFLNEGHTAYLTPQQYQDFLAYLRGDVRYSGIGLRPKRPGITVAEVFPDSPAARAGIIPGDMILAVDGDPTDGKTLEQVAQQIRGPEGTAVTLDLLRPKTGERFTLVITRASIKIDYISTDIIQDSIAYVRLRGFPEPSVADRFEEFLDELPRDSIRGLVIDLRGNGGGRIDVGVRLLNRFISSGPLFAQVDRSGQKRVQFAVGPGWQRPMPIAILIDEGTASMGEIFASAMHEHGLARLIGKRTSGNVAAAQVYPLSDGSALQVTVQEIYSGNGERLNRVGVAPDEELDTPPDAAEQGRDLPLEAAVLYLWSRSAPAAATPVGQ